MKALFVPFAPSLAHVSRCLAVAEAWRDRGHTAVFAVGAERTSLVNAAGFDARTVPEVAGEVFRTDRRAAWLSSKYFSDNLEAERAIIAETAPDVVVFDFRLTSAVAARLSSRPSVGILHGNALRLALNPRETARLLTGNAAPELSGTAAFRFRIMRRLFPAVFQLIMRLAVRRFAPILKKYGHPRVRSPFELLLGDERFAADLPPFLPSVLPPRTHVVGPLIWSGWEQPAPWLDEFDGRPLIYVTMGSTVEARSVLIKILDALRDGAYNVVVSTGSQAHPADPTLPPNIRFFPTVPGATVAGRSAAVIHLGGHETLMQALAAGMPSLMLPVNFDQILVARQAHLLGMGPSLWKPGRLPVDAGWLRTITPSDIRRAVDSLIADQSCAKTCRTFKGAIDGHQGAALAAQTLEEIARAAQDGKESP